MNPALSARSGARPGPVLCGLVACTVLLAACGLFRKGEKVEQPEYYAAVESPPLEIPEGLSRPTSNSALHILVPPAPLPQRELQSLPPRVSSTSTGKNENAVLRWGAEGAYLLVEDGLSSVHRRLGFVIDRAGMVKQALREGDGYRVEYWHQPVDTNQGFFSKLAFWRDGAPNYSGVYQVLARADGEKTRVYVKNADGSEPDPAAAEHVLVILGERLG
jgi:uncharacterized lipoprotein